MFAFYFKCCWTPLDCDRRGWRYAALLSSLPEPMQSWGTSSLTDPLPAFTWMDRNATLSLATCKTYYKGSSCFLSYQALSLEFAKGPSYICQHIMGRFHRIRVLPNVKQQNKHILFGSEHFCKCRAWSGPTASPKVVIPKQSVEINGPIPAPPKRGRTMKLDPNESESPPASLSCWWKPASDHNHIDQSLEDG